MAANGGAATKLALLIDGDNIQATAMPLILREAERLGTVAIRRVYGQFGAGRMKAWKNRLDEFRLTAVDVTPLTKGKNATDMKLVVEAMDILHGRRVDGFCIASSDRDFIALVMRVRASALACYGFGVKAAMPAYKDAFDKFVEIDTLLAQEKKTASRRAAAPKAAAPDAPPLPVKEILAAIDARKGSGDWVAMGSVGQELRKSVPNFAVKSLRQADAPTADRGDPGTGNPRDQRRAAGAPELRR